jgi:hypothetical protein
MHARGHMSNGSAVSKYSCEHVPRPAILLCTTAPAQQPLTTNTQARPLRMWRFRVVGSRLVPVDRVLLTRHTGSSRKV